MVAMLSHLVYSLRMDGVRKIGGNPGWGNTTIKEAVHCHFCGTLMEVGTPARMDKKHPYHKPCYMEMLKQGPTTILPPAEKSEMMERAHLPREVIRFQRFTKRKNRPARKPRQNR